MYGKTSVTLTGDELFYLKVAIGLDIQNVTGYMADGDSNGVWKRELEHLESAYKKIERALRRT